MNKNVGAEHDMVGFIDDCAQATTGWDPYHRMNDGHTRAVLQIRLRIKMLELLFWKVTILKVTVKGRVQNFMSLQKLKLKLKHK